MRARPVLLSAAVILFAAPALAQPKPARPAHPAAHPPAAAAAAPRAIGKFDDWTAATNMEAGQKVCYAFTRAQSSAPALPGRADVVLTVTQRASGRDAVALSAGFEYAANAAVSVMADQARLDFYTSKRSAFARDGQSAVQAFQKSGKAVARSPGPRNAEVTDSFSLRGFDKAYAAINKECPAK